MEHPVPTEVLDTLLVVDLVVTTIVTLLPLQRLVVVEQVLLDLIQMEHILLEQEL